MGFSQTPICCKKASLRLTPLTLSSRVLGYGTMAHPLGLNLISTHSLGHQSSDLVRRGKSSSPSDSTTCPSYVSSPFRACLQRSSHSTIKGIAYWSKGWNLSIWRLAKYIWRSSDFIIFVLFNLFVPFCA
ncbi:hypothetical protein H5410_002726 [Solanum commersonii]|uniref:Uncharacterized protein n=1 Tax=Solanum commersonii TaxID=4109 RepID=A0A9J6B2S6_SOLCO|nr:hypothetical protein H5410_002726 [Solanum commersonii]